VFVTIAAGVFFAALVGIGLYVLAVPENRLEVPVGGALQAEATGQAGETAPSETASGTTTMAEGAAEPEGKREEPKQ